VLMDGKAGLVTGGAGGIGSSCALRLAREGAAVVIADLEATRERGEQIVAQIGEEGGRGAFFACDVTQAEDCETLVARVVELYGKLDFAHNNAGAGPNALLHETTDEDFDATVALNLRGTFLGMKHQIRQMLKDGGGSIVNTSSTAGVMAVAGFSAYGATKHGILGLTKNAAVEYANDGIRVNAICPGAIMNEMMSASFPPEQLGAILAPQPMSRFGKPEEIAAAVTWLCSDEASFATGAVLPVDGGSVAWISAHPYENNG
jgi:NAD(P)-dependent dehydrogenase (short-subunit alcohol dehydrogenase family)